MSNIDVQQVLSLRYRTSQEADRLTDDLRKNLALTTKAQVARLSIGRSLAMGKLNDEAIDAKGQEIPATVLFTADDVGAWVGLIVAHSLLGDLPVATMDDLRAAIRRHWHRGVRALWDDWNNAGADYDRFVETLVRRRADMPDVGSPGEAAEEEQMPQTTVPTDVGDALIKTLTELGIKAEVKGSVIGPRITRYRIFLPNLSDVSKLNRSVPQLGVALNLGAALPVVSNGDAAKTMFVDLPRPRASWEKVGFDKLHTWANATPLDPNELLVYPGVDVTGRHLSFDLATAPHVLIGGTTGSGKSVCVHSIILSLLLRNSASNIQLALIDPKQVEFAQYSKLPNLYGGQVVTEVTAVRALLENLITEMDSRYSDFQRLEVRDVIEARRKGRHYPYIVLFVEELADLVLQDDEVEELLIRLAQKARAAGIHLVLATQRPDATTFSGLLRSNVPTRIGLTVQKGTESTIILDEKGAEALLGQGDMLVKVPGEGVRRAHGVFVRVEDIVRTCSSYGKG